jgi:ribosomal protein L37AE/L43A
MAERTKQFLIEELRRRWDEALVRLNTLLAPPCPGCGRKAGRPETDRSPIWQCAACGVRYLPSALVRTGAKDPR